LQKQKQKKTAEEDKKHGKDKHTDGLDKEETELLPPVPSGIRAPILPPSGKSGVPLPPGKGGPPGLPGIPKPIYKLRKLNWTKIPKNKIPGSIWESFKLCDKDSWESLLDVPTLLEYFQLEDDANKQNKPAQMVQKKTVIDLRRAQQVALIVNLLKMNPREIKNALLTFNDKVFTLDQLKSLFKLLPTDEEKNLLIPFKTATPEVILTLGDAEKFYLEIMDVAKLGEKIQMQIAWKTFQTNGTRIKEDINKITIAVNELRASRKLPGILEVVLWIGNFLNYGTAAGQGFGFTVDSLMKINDSRSPKSPAYTVLTYLTWFIVTKKSNLIGFGEELTTVRHASLENVNAIINEIKELSAAYQLLDASVSAPQQEPDATLNKLKDIQTVMKKELDELTTRQSSMEGAYNEMLKYYAHERTIDVPTIVSNFTKLFEYSIREHLKKEEEVQAKADKRKTQRVKAEKDNFSTSTSRKGKSFAFGKQAPPSLPSTGPVAPELPPDSDSEDD